MTDVPSRESRLRRTLAKHDHRLAKPPSRHWTRAAYGVGYMVVDYSNTVRLGCFFHEYDATLEQVEDYAASLE